MDRVVIDAVSTRRAYPVRFGVQCPPSLGSISYYLETASAYLVVALADLAASQRRVKKGLATRQRTVILMLDEVIITQTPPLYSGYGRTGQPVQVPITGQRGKRILHGALNIKSGEVALMISPAWTQDTHQLFLRLIRAHWRGWQIVLFEDRGSPHTAEGSLRLAAELNPDRRCRF